MKLSFREIEPFVKNPSKNARVILIYGPDSGLVKERANIIGKSVVADLNDPFNAVTLTAEQLAEDPARLSDEAGAISMMGGDRLIRVENASDKLTVIVKEYLENASQSALVTLHAGELGPRSSLRKLCEKEKNAVALPCYVEDERDVSRLIRETVTAENMRIDNDAVTWMAGNIAGDRGRVRSELEKLVIYMGQGGATVRLADVQAVCGAQAEQGFDNLVYAVAGRNAPAAMKAYATLMEEGVAFVAILRSLQNHFRRLHQVHSEMGAGADLDSAMRTLQPPVFFKQVPAFKGHLNGWSLNALNQVMNKLTDLEAQCKQTGMPVETLCSQAILAISKSRAA